MTRVIDALTLVALSLGGLLAIGAMAATIGDVLARWLFAVGFYGLVDVTQLAVVGFAYLAMPRAFWTRAHVAVELYDHRLSPRQDAALSVFAGLLALFVLSLLAWYGWTQAQRALRYGDASQNLEIPMIAFWTVILSSVALSYAICLLQVVQAAVRLVRPGAARADA